MDTQFFDANKLTRLSALLKVDPTNAKLRCDCLDAALQGRDYQSALSLAEEGLVQSPHNELFLFGKANALIGRGAYPDAISLLEQLQGIHPANSPNGTAIGQNLALCYYCLADYAAACRHLESLYALNVRTADIVRLLVSSYHHLGSMDRAIAVADENKELIRSDSALAGVCALAYLDDSRAADAAKCAAYSLRINPRCVDALTVNATLRIASGDTQIAQREFEELLQINPKIGRAWVGLGSLALLQSNFAQAKSDLARGLEYMPGHVGSWHMLAWTHLVSGNLAEAERLFQHAMELDRNFAETHGALAAIAALRGNVEHANEQIRIALRLDPNSLAARFAQSVLATRIGDSAQAQQLVQEALAKLLTGDRVGITKLLAAATKRTAAQRR